MDQGDSYNLIMNKEKKRGCKMEGEYDCPLAFSAPPSAGLKSQSRW